MLETLNTIEAYLNSKHIKGETDSLGREKPFFNIVIAACNIWFRATDIDRKNIKIKATKSKDTIDAFLATVLLQEWMRRERFGTFLNEWGRVLSRYGSAVPKFIENDEGLHPMITPWNRIICDQVDFDNDLKIEILELTEAQLRKKKGYNKEMVEKLCQTIKARETVDKHRKDTKNKFIKLYEVRGELPVSMLTGEEKDKDEYTQQMHVVTFLAKKDSHEFDEFTLVSGREAKDPMMITHLIKEDGRTLSKGPVELLFDAQWMKNHTAKAIKDQLDLASKLIFQTSDGSFVGQNALTAIETGDILIHAINQPLTQINNGSHDITQLQNYGAEWKALASEITGISEAMLGAQPKSGTAWRQTEALLAESYSLFELMTENKGLQLEEMMRVHVIPFLKKKIDTSEEVSAILEAHDLERIDSMYIKNKSIKQTNQAIKDRLLKRQRTTPEEQAVMMQEAQTGLKQSLNEQGNQRFFKPSEISDKTWKEQFKDLEWEVEVDITGESVDPNAVTTLDTLLKFIVSKQGQPMTPEEKLIFNKIMIQTGTVSPLELSAIPSPIQPQTLPVNADGGSTLGVGGLANITQ